MYLKLLQVFAMGIHSVLLRKWLFVDEVDSRKSLGGSCCTSAVFQASGWFSQSAHP